MTMFLDAIVNVQTYLAWPGPVLLLGGVLIGTLFGVLPGLGGPQAIVLLLPLTIGLELDKALVLLIAAQAGTYFSGSLTSILVGIPGTPVNAATILDGHPLARQGKAGLAVGASATASALGGVLGALILMLIIPFAQTLILSFSYEEFCALGLFGISMITLLGGDRIKGVIAACAGFLLGTIGFDPLVTLIRFGFGIEYLWDGIKIIPASIGLFGIAEAIDLFVQRRAVAGGEIIGGMRGIWNGMVSVFRHFSVFLRGSMIGVGIGIIPGIGAAVAQFIAYASAKSSAKDQSMFGRGDIRGVIGPEASNNAKDGGALVPTLIFGIPGSVDTAILLGVFMIHGVAPGLKMLTQTPEIPAAVIMTLAIANVVSVAFGLSVAPQLIKLTKIPGSILGAPIMGFAMLGAYAADGVFEDVIVTFLLGLLGYYMKRNGFSRVCLIIGLLLGEVVERNFRQALMVSGFTGFVTRPIALLLLISVVILILWPLLKGLAKKGRERKAAERTGKMILQQMVLNCVFLALGTCFLIVSFSYRLGAGGLFPLLVAAATIAVVTSNMIREWGAFKKTAVRADAGEAAKKESKETDVMWAFLWLLALVVALGYINYIAAISVFILLSLKLYAKQNWPLSVAVAAGVGGVIYLIFQVLLHTANL